MRSIAASTGTAGSRVCVRAAAPAMPLVSSPRLASGRATAPRPAQQLQREQLVARGDAQRAGFFKFGKNGVDSESAGVVGSQGRDDYCYDDVEAYFNYMGCLAEEGTYDRMYAVMKGRHPVDAILLLAAPENDTPKIAEILKAGADPNVKDDDGKTPLELATKQETIDVIKEYADKVAA